MYFIMLKYTHKREKIKSPKRHIHIGQIWKHLISYTDDLNKDHNTYVLFTLTMGSTNLSSSSRPTSQDIHYIN